MNGARWVQEELLDKHTKADVRVYAVWFSMYPTDERENWPADVLTDRRVVHWWDEEKRVGRWYMQRAAEMRSALAPESAGFAGDVLWDAYLVYGADAKWETASTQVRKWGRTILRTQDGLREAFDAVLQEQRQ